MLRPAAPAIAPLVPAIAPAAAQPHAPISAPTLAPMPVRRDGAPSPTFTGEIPTTPSGYGPIPPSGPIERLSEAQVAGLAAMAKGAEQLDYFQLLKVKPEAGLAEIKKAFYAESRTYHPDRFFHLADAGVKASIGTLYKRVTEAYYFLRDDTKRKKYAADISGPERTARLRFTEASENETKAQVKKEQEEQIGTTPKGRQFYASAMADYDRGNWQGAERNLKMAVTYEPANAKYKERLNEVQQKLHDDFKNKGEQFKIR